PRLSRHTLYQLALLEGRPEMAELFARYGASRAAPALDDAERFVDAVLRLDREAARSLLTSHPEYRESPHAMFEAARRDRPEALALLLDLGFPLEIQDRTGKRALHEAAFSNAIQAAAFLVERGAAIDPRESTYNGTPIGWSPHGVQRRRRSRCSPAPTSFQRRNSRRGAHASWTGLATALPSFKGQPNGQASSRSDRTTSSSTSPASSSRAPSPSLMVAPDARRCSFSRLTSAASSGCSGLGCIPAASPSRRQESSR